VRRISKALVAALTLLVIVAVAQAIADTAPTPTIQAASEISYTSAKLKGKVNPNGGPSTTTWQFQYSSEGTEGPWTPGPEGHLEGTEAEENTPLSVEGELSGLKPNTTYYTRLVATNEGGQSSVSAPSFATLEVAAPSVTIEAVPAPTSSTAQLSGHINPNAPEAAPASAAVEAGFSVSWHFQCTPDCGNPSGDVVAADNAEHEVSAEATGLLPGTKYKVSLVAENAGTSATAGPEEFTTEANAPSINSVSFSDVTTTGATLRAAIDPSGAPTTYRFEYTADADFQANGFDNATRVPVTDASVGSAPGQVVVSQVITGLDSDTKYDFRVVASNSVDSAESDAKVFTTFATSAEGPQGQFPGQGFLPNNRAWEMVSPQDKHGGGVTNETQQVHVATDGEAIAFPSEVGFGDVRGISTGADYIAERDGLAGTNGWSTHAITPRLAPLTVVAGGLNNISRFSAEFSPDLSSAVYESFRPLGGSPNSAAATNVYRLDGLRSAGGGSAELMSDSFKPLPSLLEPLFGGPPPPAAYLTMPPWIAGASTDIEHVLFETHLPLTEDAIFTGLPSVYESSGGVPHLVSRVPGGSATFCDDAGGPACQQALGSKAGLGAGEPTVGFLPGFYTPHVISNDGSRVFFQAPPALSGGKLYVREDGARTYQLNASEKAIPEDPKPAKYWDASTDGSRVFFTTEEGLVEGDDGSGDLYMYEVGKPEGERLTLLSDGTEEPYIVGASDDGRYVYFFLGTALYLWHDGQVAAIGDVGDVFAAALNTPALEWQWGNSKSKFSRVSPDGRHLLFIARSDAGLVGHGGFTGYDHGGGPRCGVNSCAELYLYSADTGKLQCASCNPSGAPATSDALDNISGNDVGARFLSRTQHQNQALSKDGRYVFFSTAEALVPQDSNGTWDAYVYDTQTEEPHLLSSGEDKNPSYFLDASPDGRDVFISTSQRLSRWDVDGAYDIYDARIGGGLPEPRPVPPACQGDACQPAPRELNDPTPSSSSFKGPGDPTHVKKKKRHGRKKHHARKHHKRAQRQINRNAKNDRRASR
jgi:hypothetical protein